MIPLLMNSVESQNRPDLQVARNPAKSLAIKELGEELPKNHERLFKKSDFLPQLLSSFLLL